MDETGSNQHKVRRPSAAYGPLALVLLFLVAMLVMSLFFRVSEVEVINASDYSDEEIIVASGIEKGANLFFVDRFSAASMIFSDLPYMDTVSIQRRLPGRIIIQAEGSAPAAYLRLDEEYWLIDRNGKMLGVTSALQAEEYPEIRSLEPLTAMEGVDMIVEGPNEERLAYTAELLNALQGEDMMSLIRWIDVKNSADPTLYYDGRLTVYLGERDNTAYKIAQLKDVAGKLAQDDTGTLRYAGGTSWTFSPD